MDMMEIRRRVLMATGGTQNLKLLRTLTFVNTNERQTFSPDANWADFDFLLIIPDLTVTYQEGLTDGNWLWFQMSGARGNANQFEGTSTQGIRDMTEALLLTKGWYADRYYWRATFVTGRTASLQLKTALDINSETFADLTYSYGGYMQGTNALLNGTVKIYGCKLPTE